MMIVLTMMGCLPYRHISEADVWCFGCFTHPAIKKINNYALCFIPLFSCVPPLFSFSPLWFEPDAVSFAQAQLSARFYPTWCYKQTNKTRESGGQKGLILYVCKFPLVKALCRLSHWWMNSITPHKSPKNIVQPISTICNDLDTLHQNNHAYNYNLIFEHWHIL